MNVDAEHFRQKFSERTERSHCRLPG